MYCTNINFDASPQFYATTRLDVNTPLYTNVGSSAGTQLYTNTRLGTVIVSARTPYQAPVLNFAPDTQFELPNIIQLRFAVAKHRPQLSVTPAVNAIDHKKRYSKIPMWITAKVTSYPHGDFISVSHHD
ncbi:hypothetical protein C6Y08_09470 [Lactiplantibacillus pentosus]|uniref:DUF961 domain-containing protein n=1 Tax=Lactiplantibacillus pentosus TaxID=1589 RepID=A0ABD7IPM5_LACPE|nr:hypothetical protein C6Y08_09470 [Lactiplantibacillus pentosus]RMW47119.1 hypothetical protein D6U18_08510 [Lactiplantibacillus pentosus]